MMVRFDLSDAEWSIVALLLPNKRHGVRVQMAAGSPWRGLPEHCEP